MGRNLSEAKIWKFFIEISLGLHYLHSFRILHRDIKTINMFLGKDDKVKIGDLGVAKLLNQTNNMAHTIVGTPYYLSPELCEEKPYNHKSDIWSLGCVIYELVSLIPPFTAGNHLALAQKILAGKIERIPERYSEDLQEVIQQMLNVDSTKRPSVEELIKLPKIKLRINERKLRD